MKIGIIIAMDKEFRRISELLDGQKRTEAGYSSWEALAITS